MFSVYIINQEHRTDRREHMIDLMSRLNIPSYKFVVPIKVNKPVSKASKSQESLFFTVLSVLQNHQGAKTHAMILEDDIDINPELNIQPHDIMTHVSSTCKDLPNDWDAFKLELCYNMCFMSKHISKHVRKTFFSFCMGAVIYNVNRIDPICECIKTYNPHVLDHALVRCKPRLIVYYHSPAIFVQFHQYGSEIEGSMKYTTFDKLLSMNSAYKDECIENYSWLVYILIIIGAIFLLYRISKSK